MAMTRTIPASLRRKASQDIHELLSRDQEDGRATWQPQGVGFRT
jgi:hypothetical protein